MKSLEDEADFKVTWKPFFLNPNTPEEGIPLVEYISSRYGAEAGRKIAEGKSPLVQVGKQLGISFNKDRNVVNTLKSHCMLELAKSSGKQDSVAEELFKVYFEQGSDINSEDVLAMVAKETGLDQDELKSCLQDKKLQEEIFGEVRNAQVRGIHGVPFFDIYIDGFNNTRPSSFSGAQDSDMFVDLFKRLLASFKSKA